MSGREQHSSSTWRDGDARGTLNGVHVRCRIVEVGLRGQSAETKTYEVNNGTSLTLNEHNENAR